MSALCNCGHAWSYHDSYSPFHRQHYGRCHYGDCLCVAPSPTEKDATAMTDKTPPYVIDFDDIRKGMTIERQWEIGGEVHYRAEAVADHLSEDDAAWLTSDGYLVANKGTTVLRVLAEPPKPELPEHRIVWSNLMLRYECSCREWDQSPALTVDFITDHLRHALEAATAPKADDGLRERVQELADSIAETALLDGDLNASEVYRDLLGILLAKPGADA